MPRTVENPRYSMLSFRVTDDERDIFWKEAKRRGIKVSDLLRERLFGKSFMGKIRGIIGG